MADKIKLMLFSDSMRVPTGYSRVCRELVARFNPNKFDVTWFGKQTLGQPAWGNFDFGMYKQSTEDIYKDMLANNGDKSDFQFKQWWLKKFCRELCVGDKQDGGDIVDFHLAEHKPDILMILQDMWMTNWILDKDFSPTRLIYYTPLDGHPTPFDCHKHLLKIDQGVAMSEFGKQVILDTEYFDGADAKYHKLKDSLGYDLKMIPHGVDINKFTNWSDEKKLEAKKRGNFEGKYIFQMVTRNQPRKHLTLLYDAWKKFSADKNDVILHMHTDKRDPMGYQLEGLQIVKKLKNIYYTKVQSYKMLLPDNELAEVYNMADVQISSTCIHPNTIIQTKQGPKEIKDITAKSEVLTSAGKFRKVIKKIATKNWHGKILNIKADGLPMMKITSNHNIYRIPCEGYAYKKQAKEWKQIILEEAKTLSKYDYLVYPIPQTTETKTSIDNTSKYIKLGCGGKKGNATFIHPTSHKLPTEINLDYNFGLLCGFYLAEGCWNKDGLALCFNTKEKYFYNKLDKILKQKFKLTTRIRHNTRNRTILFVNNVTLGRLFGDLFGHNSHNKKLPNWILDSSKQFRYGLLQGLWKGDGCAWVSHKCANVFELQTVSKQLAYQVFNLILAEGFNITLASQQRKSIVWKLRINGEQNFSEFIDMKNAINIKKRKSRIWRDNNNIYFPISKITSEDYSGTVYDLNVDKEHNFVCSSLVKNSGEGFGIPTVEAMASGQPAIITNYTTSAELLNHPNPASQFYQCDKDLVHCPNGILVPYTQLITGGMLVERALVDSNKLAEAMQYAYDNQNEMKQKGKAARKFVEEKYSWDNLAKEWEKLFEGMANG